MLDQADLIVMYLQPLTISPVSLIELGIFSSTVPKPNMVVCCPEGFHRKGNVDIVCEWTGIPSVETFKDLIDYVGKWIKENT